MKNKHNLLKTISIFWKWRKQILAVTAIATIGSAILLLMMPNYYKAVTIFYPASQDFTKPTIIRGISYFGQSADEDRIFSIVKSNELVDSMVSKFELYRRYDIEKTDIRSKNTVRKKFRKLCTSKKTKYGAVQIAVEDTDRDTAAIIANSVRDMVNGISWKIIRDSQKKIMDASESKFGARDKQLKELTDSLTNVKKKYEIFIIGPQGESLVEARSEVEFKYEQARAKIEIMKENAIYRDSIDYWRAEELGYRRQMNRLNKSLSNYNEGFSKVVTLESLKREFSNQLTVDKERYHELKASYDNQFSSLHVVEEAESPVIKSRPKRLVFVLSAALVAFVLSLISVLMIESYQKINWNRILHD